MIPSSTSPFASPSQKPISVLVADDSLEVQLLLRRWLEEGDFAVTCVSCGNEAIQALKVRPFDLLITEIIMPNGDGLEVILELRKYQPQARIVALSAGGRYLPATECLRVAKGLGAHETLLKPAKKGDLLAAIERAMATAVKGGSNPPMPGTARIAGSNPPMAAQPAASVPAA